MAVIVNAGFTTPFLPNSGIPALDTDNYPETPASFTSPSTTRTAPSPVRLLAETQAVTQSENQLLSVFGAPILLDPDSTVATKYSAIDTFETNSGDKYTNVNGGVWSINSGHMDFSALSIGRYYEYRNDVGAFADGFIQLDLDASTWVGVAAEAVMRFTSPTSGHLLLLTAAMGWNIYEYINGGYSLVPGLTGSSTQTPGTPTTWNVQLDGATVTVFRNGAQVGSGVTSVLNVGYSGLSGFVDAPGKHVYYDNLTIIRAHPETHLAQRHWRFGTNDEPAFNAIQQTLPMASDWFSVAWNGKVFAAVAYGTNIAATSPDGITWTQQTLPTVAGWFGIAWNGTVFCITADNSDIAATSPDGITWTQRTLPTVANWLSIEWSGTSFCAIGYNSDVAATSPDGITWTQQTMPFYEGWYGVAWNGTVFCATTNPSNAAATSPDGITWAPQTLPISAPWTSITWNGTVFCVLAELSDIAATSPDGITWTQRTLPTSSNWYGLAWNGAVFCAAASYDSSIAATSPDGITWTQRTLPIVASWSGIASNGSAFCVVSFNTSDIAATISIDTAPAVTVSSTGRTGTLTQVIKRLLNRLSKTNRGVN